MMGELFFHSRRLLLTVIVAAWLLSAPFAITRAVYLRQTQSVQRQGRNAQLIAEGAAALERGDASAARRLFEQAIASDPNNPALHTYLGAIADGANDLETAERHFATASRLAPRSASARNNYGVILLRRGRSKEAAAEFEASLQLDPQQLTALVNLAQICFASGSPDALRAARNLFERAQRIAPDVQIARALVVTSLRLGDRARAAASYREYLALLERASNTAAYRAVAATAARAELGAALLESKLAEEAIKELEAAVASDKANVPVIIQLARAYLERKDVAAAGRTLESAVARGLDDARIYAALADVYETIGRPENAIPAMRLAVERDPKSEAYRFRYAMLLTDTKAPAAAVIRLQEALKDFPRSSRLWFALGVAFIAQDKYNEAVQPFQRAIEIDSKFAPAIAYLGITHEQAGRYAEAIEFYEQALKVDERLVVAHHLAANALLKQTSSDTARAEAHLVRAVELDSSFTPARLALGKLYSRTNRFAEAAAQLERAIATEPNLVEAYYQLGQVYNRLKRTTDAQAAFAKFKELNQGRREQDRDKLRELARRLANVRF